VADAAKDQPDDYVIATGETHEVKEFLELAFGYVNLDWQDYVEFDERYLRPAEVELLLGDPTKSREKLGWEPSVTFEQLVGDGRSRPESSGLHFTECKCSASDSRACHGPSRMGSLHF
jgi:GDP-D-mannose dehydratase